MSQNNWADTFRLPKLFWLILSICQNICSISMPPLKVISRCSPSIILLFPGYGVQCRHHMLPCGKVIEDALDKNSVKIFVFYLRVRAKREIDLVKMRSIFPCSHQRIIRWNSCFHHYGKSRLFKPQPALYTPGFTSQCPASSSSQEVYRGSGRCTCSRDSGSWRSCPCCP